jgi:sugar phosphate isomerase/epimerase
MPYKSYLITGGVIMRFGLLSWSIRSLGDGAPWEDSLKVTAKLGYTATELITCQPEDLDSYWKPKSKSLKDLCASLGLSISQFAMFQPVVGNLISPDKKKKELAFEYIKKSADIANQLGTKILNFVAQWPVGIEAPVPYIPRYYYVIDIGGEPKLKMKLPRPLRWNALWDEYLEAVGRCLKICAEHDLQLSIENHLHTMVPTTDAFLRIWDHFKDDRLGCNLDIGWSFLGREYVPTSILKLNSRLVNIHLRDCDGFAHNFVCPGMGAIDYGTIREALDEIGYKGDVNVELSEFEKEREYISGIALRLSGGFFK